MTAPKTKQNIDQLCINTIRTLSLDAVQKLKVSQTFNKK
jgi:transketolase